MNQKPTGNVSDPQCPLAPETGPRRVNQLETWTFINDRTEKTVTVPHTWNEDQILDDPSEYERGRKRYRTTVETKADEDSRQLLHFEGGNQTTIVRIDGEEVGTHNGGYTAFTIDATEHLSDQSPSTIEVTVDNTHNDNVPPMDADFTFFGGLYRPVWLVETSDVHLDGTNYGSSGVYVDTPSVGTKSAMVRVRADIVNHRSTAASVDVTHRVVDEGMTITEFGSTVTIGPDGNRSVETVSDPIENPTLWCPDNPHCYTVKTTVEVNGTPTDLVESPLGIREIDLKEGRVTINGEPVPLRGTNRHQDRPGLGNALSDREHLEDIELIANMGLNFLRLAHYPQSKTVISAADERGLLLWEEIPVINWVTDTIEHRENCHTRLKEMVRQHYNHPSVGIWGFMNEIVLGYDMDYFEGIDEDDVAVALDLATELDGLLREEDPTRLTAMACHGSWEYERFGFADIPDVLGWNLYHGWYYGEVDYMPGVLYEKIAARPEQATMVSEYGIGADTRLHTTEPTPWDFTEEYHSYYHKGYIAAFDEFPELAGTAQWNAFDFASDGRIDTIPGINQKGLMTHDREPKSAYHLYRAWRSDDPVVHIATRHWQRRSSASRQSDGTHPISVHSNLPVVELFVNDESRGTKQTDDCYTATWDVSLSTGSNDIRALARDENDTTVEDETRVELVPFDIDPSRKFPKTGLSINVGSHREIVTEEELWAPDQSYEESGIGWGAIGGEHIETLSRIYETNLAPLYQHALEGLDSYHLDFPAGTYRIELEWCEFIHEKAGQRVFSVEASGESIVTDFDPVASAGIRTPVSMTSEVILDDEELVLDFKATSGATLLNALRIERC